jgi:hypothetical protein
MADGKMLPGLGLADIYQDEPVLTRFHRHPGKSAAQLPEIGYYIQFPQYLIEVYGVRIANP